MSHEPYRFDRRLAGVDAVICLRPERAVNADAIRVAAGEQRGARRRTDSLRHMKIGELRALAREPIDVGRRVAFGAKDPEIAVTLVIGEHDDDVGQAIGGT